MCNTYKNVEIRMSKTTNFRNRQTDTKLPLIVLLNMLTFLNLVYDIIDEMSLELDV